jgi:hypothetical protein
MLASFNGAKEVISAYEFALTHSDIGLTVIKNVLGTSSIEAVRTAALMDDPDERVRGLQEVLYNDTPLKEAEGRIAAWASQSNLPTGLRTIPTLEAPVKERRGATLAHFDSAAAPSNLILGPFAFSLGTVGWGKFRGLRIPRKLTDSELLGAERLTILEAASHRHTKNGRFKPGVITDNVVQRPGDIVLIPGSPQPSLHSVEVPKGSERKSVICSYVITPNSTASAAELRKQAIEVRTRDLQFIVGAIKHLSARGQALPS